MDSNLDTSQRNRKALLPFFIVVGVGAVAVAIYMVSVAPQSQLSKYGVGANGFHAYTEQGGDLGISNLVSKQVVVSALGDKAKPNSVSDVQVSNVFNYNDNRGQTATFTFLRADGIQASVFADLMKFKNQSDFNAAHLTLNTLDTGLINKRQSYYMLAQTMGNTEEYRLLVVDGLKAYKFVMVQPVNNVQINEVSSLAILKKIAEKAQF